MTVEEEQPKTLVCVDDPIDGRVRIRAISEDMALARITPVEVTVNDCGYPWHAIAEQIQAAFPECYVVSDLTFDALLEVIALALEIQAHEGQVQ